MLRDPTLQVDSDGMLSLLEKRSGAQALALDAKALAERFATPLQANVLLLGFAWQAGLVPLRLDAVRQAIRLQGGSGDDNLAAFDCGRLAAGDPDALRQLDGGERTQDEFDDYERLKLSRMRLLAEYQNPEYAARYLRRLGKVEQATRDWQGEDAVQAEALRIAVARNLYKLMACKDEYEVARQLSDRGFCSVWPRSTAALMACASIWRRTYSTSGADSRARWLSAADPAVDAWSGPVAFPEGLDVRSFRRPGRPPGGTAVAGRLRVLAGHPLRRP